MSLAEIRHIRAYIAYECRTRALDEHSRDKISQLLGGIDVALDAIEKGTTVTVGESEYSPLTWLGAVLTFALISVNNAELQDLVLAQRWWLIDKGVLHE